jgi:hypothetical protein
LEQLHDIVEDTPIKMFDFDAPMEHEKEDVPPPGFVEVGFVEVGATMDGAETETDEAACQTPLPCSTMTMGR